MKKTLLPLLSVFIGFSSFAQQDVVALAGKNNTSIVFSDFRYLNIAKGVSGNKIFSAESSPKIFSQQKNIEIKEDKANLNNAQANSMATVAYDFYADKLIYMPMFSSNIYVLDAKKQNIVLVENNVAKTTACDLSSHFTRMTLGYDGKTYALNNAGTQLLQISKQAGQYVVKDLGAVSDDASNGNNTLKQMATGFGGDMIADADNNFYIFSASGNVFKFTTKTMSVKFLGKISGLPADYTVNGAAVIQDGSVLIASSKAQNFFSVNLDNLTSRQVSFDSAIPVYDLASSYFAHDNKLVTANFNKNLTIFPTRVEDKYINVRLQNEDIKGNLTLKVYSSSGQLALSKNLAVKNNSDERVDLLGLNAGVYLVTISDNSGKQLLGKKILISE